MCGLFAGIGKLNSGRMIALGSMNEERGTDSVGLAYTLDGQLTVAKIAERPCVALNMGLRKAVTEAAVSGLFIGHTRQATQGTVNDRNAHPFLDQGIAFAHNGIILNDDEFGNYEVDSESLIHGIKAKDFSKYEGAIALVWIEDGLLKAYRCGNPLYRGRHNGSIYLASDDEYLKAIGCTHVKQIVEGMIYTFHNASKITTERVKRNKSFSYVEKGYSGVLGLGSSYADYKMNESTPLTPGDKQVRWWEQEKEEEEAMEDFRTAKDMERETHANLDASCECCGDFTELNENGMCLACFTWLKDNGINDSDIPPSIYVTR